MSSGVDRFNVLLDGVRAAEERVERVVLGPRAAGWSLEDCGAAPVECDELADLLPRSLVLAIEKRAKGQEGTGGRTDSISSLYTNLVNAIRGQ